MSRLAKFIVLLLPVLLFSSGCSITSRQRGPVDPAMDAAYSRIMTAMLAGDYAQAVPLLEKRVASIPEDIDAPVNLAIAYRETGQLDKALDVLEKDVARNPDQAAAQHQLGIVHRQLGHFDHALEAYKNAIRIDDHYALAHRNLGILYDIYLQQPEAALAEYERYIELSGDEDTEVNGWVADLKHRVATTQARAR